MDKPYPSGLKTTFLIHAIIALIFGLANLLVPQMWNTLTGTKIVDYNIFRLLGAAILAFGLSSWLAYRAKSWESVSILLQMEILWTILATLIFVYYQVRRGFPPIYWVNAMIMAAFAVAFIYFYWKRKE